MPFTLHPQLANDCAHLCDLSVCRVLLMNDVRFPWLILVPMRDGMRELFDLSPQDYQTAMQEVRQISAAFASYTSATKMNIAALGNMVPQLHIHIIARFENDSAWPAPIWNSTIAPRPYSQAELIGKIEEIRIALN